MGKKEPILKGTGFNVFKIEMEQEVTIYGGFGVNCGFPSPAKDFEADAIDLNKMMVKNPNTTFYAIAVGDSLEGLGIYDGAIMTIDRSYMPMDGEVAICELNKEYTCKQVRKINGEMYLMPHNPKYEPILLKEGDELVIWGVVTWASNKLSKR